MGTTSNEIYVQTHNFYKSIALNEVENLLRRIEKKVLFHGYIHQREMITMSNKNIPIKISGVSSRTSSHTDFLIITPENIFIIDVDFWIFNEVKYPVKKHIKEPVILGSILYDDLYNTEETKVHSLDSFNRNGFYDTEFINGGINYNNPLHHTRYKSTGLQKYLNSINLPYRNIKPITFLFHHINDISVNNKKHIQNVSQTLLIEVEAILFDLINPIFNDHNSRIASVDASRLANIINNFNL